MGWSIESNQDRGRWLAIEGLSGGLVDDVVEMQRRLNEQGGILTRTEYWQQLAERQAQIERGGVADSYVLMTDAIHFSLLAEDGFGERTGLVREIALRLKTPEAQAEAMKGNLTFGLIKPDLPGSVKPDVMVGMDDAAMGKELLRRIHEESGLQIVLSVTVQWTREQAERHYAVHRDKPFFGELVDYICSGPQTLLVLYSPDGDAVEKWRQYVNLIREEMMLHLSKSIMHGSDSKEMAWSEIEAATNDVLALFDQDWMYRLCGGDMLDQMANDGSID